MRVTHITLRTYALDSIMAITGPAIIASRHAGGSITSKQRSCRIHHHEEQQENPETIPHDSATI